MDQAGLGRDVAAAEADGAKLAEDFLTAGRAKVEEALAPLASAADHLGPAFQPLAASVKAALSSLAATLLSHVSEALHGKPAAPVPSANAPAGTGGAPEGGTTTG